VQEAGVGMVRRTARRIWAGYRRRVRPLLPASAPVRYSGIPVPIDRRIGDRFLSTLLGPFGIEDVPDYESALVAGLNRHVRAGDMVVIVGGGIGVTATVAARRAAPNGRVVCFEGGAEAFRRTGETVALNGMAARATIRHAIVGPAIDIPGEVGNAGRVDPEDLPQCDLLELDCEGAEIEILSRMKIRPRTILVETHGVFGAPAASVAGLLQAKGYGVSDLGPAEPRLAAFCETNDIRVLCGRREVGVE
jgi:hypothetical protein